MNEALIESFLKFDSVLLDLDVKKILQKLANNEQEESYESLNSNEDNLEEALLLKKEAEVPIEELIKNYNGDEKYFHSPNISQRIIKEKNYSESQIVTIKSDDDDDDTEEVISIILISFI